MGIDYEFLSMINGIKQYFSSIKKTVLIIIVFSMYGYIFNKYPNQHMKYFFFKFHNNHSLKDRFEYLSKILGFDFCTKHVCTKIWILPKSIVECISKI